MADEDQRRRNPEQNAAQAQVNAEAEIRHLAGAAANSQLPHPLRLEAAKELVIRLGILPATLEWAEKFSDPSADFSVIAGPDGSIRTRYKGPAAGARKEAADPPVTPA
jgi:hypothetical protein